MKYSIIIPHFNNLYFLINCITSIRQHTKDFQLIIVDDGSSDGSVEWIKSECLTHDDTTAVFFDKNSGFPAAINAGLADAAGDYIILLNNDVLVTPDWADSMVNSIPTAKKELNLLNIGMVGPVSNYAGGQQGIQTDPYQVDQLAQGSVDHRKEYKNRILFTGFLSGFCLLITRDCLEDVGLFDEDFSPGLWEDNDYCLRAQLKGWQLIIDQSTFIHHFGSSTFRPDPSAYNRIFSINQMKFYYKHYDNKPKKLIGLVRVKNQPDFLSQSLIRASKFCDEIIVLCDNCTDDTIKVTGNFNKVTEVIDSKESFDEARDRTALMVAAGIHGADWCFSFDADEIIEDSFTRDYAEKLMHPIDPQILGYGFNFKTFFNGKTHYRTDSVFGTMWGVRMWKVHPHSYSQSTGHVGLHCTHCPPIPRFSVCRLRTRIKHYGYNSQELCQSKFNFYSKKDPNPNLRQTSPIGYRHIISDSLALMKWKENNSCSLCMVVKDEEVNLFSFLSQHYSFFDEIVIVDTGSSDKTLKIANLFQAKTYKFKFNNDFSAVRNFAKSKCTCEWIMSMDPDEKIPPEHIPTLYDMMEEPVHAWLFKFENFQKDNTVIYSDNVRLFRNLPDLKWSWFCHENMSQSITKNNFIVLAAPFNLQHFGFLKDKSIRDRKINQYGSMLKHQIKKFPMEPIGYFHYAFHLFEESKNEQAIQFLLKAVKLKNDFFLAHKELGYRFLLKSLSHIKQAAINTPKEHYYYNWLNTLSSEIERLLSRPLEV